jgi:TolA-binding protein
MKKIAYSVIIVASLAYLCACKHGQGNAGTTSGQDTSKATYLNQVKAIEAKLKNATTINSIDANLAITAYTKYAGQFPDDTLSPKFLFKAGSLAMSSGQYQRALGLYDDICNRFPKFNQTVDCIFVEGFIYDSYLKDTAKAHAKYSEVIAKFPDNNLAQQAKAAISALGKSDEELIKEFEAKNKKQGDKKAS